MNCPKCTGSLDPVSYGDDIHVHRCTDCGGLWCKPDMLEKMKAEWMAEAAIDTGNPAVGRRLDAIDDIQCPEGHGHLSKAFDVEQKHIWFEVCDTCEGVYLDAGEFTDLKFKTLLDAVRGFVKGEREA